MHGTCWRNRSESFANGHKPGGVAIVSSEPSQKLGNPNGAAALRRAAEGGVVLRATVRTSADAHARALAPIVSALREAGHVSLRALASELDARGMRTRRGGRWHLSTVKNLLERIGRLG